MMNKVFMEYLDKFVVVFIDDILVYSRCEEEHNDIFVWFCRSFKIISYSKLSTCEFWLKQVAFLEHVISRGGISMDPS
jgi:hypothetical protein